MEEGEVVWEYDLQIDFTQGDIAGKGLE